MGSRVSYAQNNDLWKQKFEQTEFFKNYQQHLAQKADQEAQMEEDHKALVQMRAD